MLFGKANQSLSVTLRHFQRSLNPWNAPRMLLMCLCLQVSIFSKLMKYNHLNNGYCWYCLWNHAGLWTSKTNLPVQVSEPFILWIRGAVFYWPQWFPSICCLLFFTSPSNNRLCTLSLSRTHRSAWLWLMHWFVDQCLSSSEAGHSKMYSELELINNSKLQV